MPAYICVTCGVQHAESDMPPATCPICEDERQYVGINGQEWTTLAELQETHHNIIEDVESNLLRIQTVPNFAISQNPYLIKTPNGNILWECNSLIDTATVERIKAEGGLRAIAISHPHFYDSMVEWSHAFGGIPIYLHEDNRQYVMRSDDVIHYWQGDTFDLGDGLSIIRCGGHFTGSSVLHWSDGAEGRGVLLTGDTIMVVSDRRYVSFMYSYPNLIPMNARHKFVRLSRYLNLSLMIGSIAVGQTKLWNPMLKMRFVARWNVIYTTLVMFLLENSHN